MDSLRAVSGLDCQNPRKPLLAQVDDELMFIQVQGTPQSIPVLMLSQGNTVLCGAIFTFILVLAIWDICSEKSRTGKPLLNEPVGSYLGNQARRRRLRLVRGRKRGRDAQKHAILLFRTLIPLLKTLSGSKRKDIALVPLRELQKPDDIPICVFD